MIAVKKKKTRCPYCDKELNWFILHLYRLDPSEFKSFRAYKVSTLKCYHCNSFFVAKNNNKLLSLLIGILLMAVCMVPIGLAVISSILYQCSGKTYLLAGIIATIIFCISLPIANNWWGNKFLTPQKTNKKI